MFKFNVGDRVKLIRRESYYVGGTLGDINQGDIVVINSRDKATVCDGNVYGFEGDGFNYPNWLYVEENFELVPHTLKQLLKEVKE